jgi:transposase
VSASWRWRNRLSLHLPVRHGILVGLKDLPDAVDGGRPKFQAMLTALHTRPDDVLRFARDLRIPPTSNQVERDLRPSKTQQKISGRLTSEPATKDRYAIRGYVSTAAKHGADLITVIRDAILGRPWTPPIPAPT